MKVKRQILSHNQITIIIERLCQELIENHNSFSETILVGIQPRATYLSDRIVKKLIIDKYFRTIFKFTQNSINKQLCWSHKNYLNKFNVFIKTCIS